MGYETRFSLLYEPDKFESSVNLVEYKAVVDDKDLWGIWEHILLILSLLDDRYCL